jgi:hypothetical protein
MFHQFGPYCYPLASEELSGANDLQNGLKLTRGRQNPFGMLKADL